MEEDDKAYKVGPTGPVLVESVVAFLDALGTQEKAPEALGKDEMDS